jgi:predicted nuclease of restriction endonuclease-like RecB superfamily
LLTADLVHVRRRGDRLFVVPVSQAERPRALELTTAYLDLARAHVGQSRGALLDACGAVAAEPREQRLARGLLKLVLDRCEFEESATLDPMALRRTIFTRAAAARAADEHAAFDRAAILSAVAAEHSVSSDTVERALFADLPDAHILREARLLSPEALLAEHHLAQLQAVLLRALAVRATVWSAAPVAYRHLFHKLKFLRLLYRIERLPKNAGYRLEIDGPYSLFESVTKYGLQLALALPALMAADRFTIEADLRWGRERQPLRYALRGPTPDQFSNGDEPPHRGHQVEEMPDEVAALLAQLSALPGPWQPAACHAILDLPGVGQCVPDLEFVHRETGQTVYLEVLGFWSRDAVWKRIELARKGLAAVVFAVSKHLRVSEAALDDGLPAALYVYARVMNAPAVLQRVQEVAARVPPVGNS